MMTPRTHSAAPGFSTMRLVVTLGLGLLVLGVVGVIVLWRTNIGVGGLRGAADRLEDWVGSQIVGIGNSYLVPQIAYDEIDYQAPGTVTMEGVTFTAPDGTKVLELAGMTVILAEVPKLGEPIVIEKVVLDNPTARLIREVNGEGETGFRGLNPIVKNAPTRDESVDENFRLSNVLRLREIEFIEGSLYYDQGDGSPPMTISGFTTTVTSTPDDAEPGWYALDIESAVGPLADLALTGRLSLDDFTAEITELSFEGQLSPETAESLPPQLQSLVQEFEARGQVDLTASGTVPLTDPLAGTLEATLGLREFRVASGEFQFPLDSVNAEASLDGGVARLSRLEAETLRGRISAEGEARLTEPGRPASASWKIDHIELRELLRANTAADGPPKLAGDVVGSGSLSTTLDDPRGGLSGSGEVHLDKGRVVMLPGLKQMADLMDVATQFEAGEEALRHTLDAEFNLEPQGMRVTASEVQTEFLAARATGTIGFDRALDLTVNGGPLEKVQSLLGGLGDALGAVTDQLVKYRVRGTIAEPEVSVAPLGIGG